MQKLERKWLVASVFALAAVAGLLAGNWKSISIFASPAPDLFSMIPAGAPTLAFIDLSAMRDSPIYKNRKNRSPIALPNADYANFVAETGFDFEHDLDRVAIAFWPKTPSTVPAEAVIVAEGRFDRAKIRVYAAKHGKIVQQLNHEVFVFPPKPGSPSSVPPNSVVFLDDRHLGMIQGTDAGPLLTVHGIGSTDPMEDHIARVQDAAAFFIIHASEFPVGANMSGTSAAQFAGLAQSIDWAALAISGEGNGARISVEGECKTPAAAQQLDAALELLRQLGLAGLSDPKTSQKMGPATFAAVKNLISSLEIKETDNRVRVLMEVTPEILNLLNAPKTAGTGIANR